MYKVVLVGIKSGVEPKDAINKLSLLFKIKPDMVESILNKNGYTIKSGLSESQAKIYVAAIEKAGGACTITCSEPTNNSDNSSSSIGEVVSAKESCYVSNVKHDAIPIHTEDGDARAYMGINKKAGITTHKENARRADGRKQTIGKVVTIVVLSFVILVVLSAKNSSNNNAAESINSGMKLISIDGATPFTGVSTKYCEPVLNSSDVLDCVYMQVNGHKYDPSAQYTDEQINAVNTVLTTQFVAIQTNLIRLVEENRVDNIPLANAANELLSELDIHRISAGQKCAFESEGTQNPARANGECYSRLIAIIVAKHYSWISTKIR